MKTWKASAIQGLGLIVCIVIVAWNSWQWLQEYRAMVVSNRSRLPRLERLLPAAKAHPVTFHNSTNLPSLLANGALNGEDMLQISNLMGRIPDISYDVDRLKIAFETCPIALEVASADWHVFFVKLSNGKWQVTDLQLQFEKPKRAQLSLSDKD